MPVVFSRDSGNAERSCIRGGDGLCFSAEGVQLDADILCEGHFGIYRTKEAVREYIMDYIRVYAGDDVNP
jgi:hypothetical protein